MEQKEQNWLVEPFIDLHEKLKENVAGYYKETDIELFTLHDETHCLNVEKMIKAIVSRTEDKIDTLTDVERFLLSCAAWTHDIGMNSEIATNYFMEIYGGEKEGLLKNRRKEHHNISCWYLHKEGEKLFGLEEKQDHPIYRKHINIIRSISTIIKYHRKSEDIASCEEERYINNKKVRLKLMAAIFRLADTLHKDASRFDPNQYAMVQIASFDRTSRLHWLKSFFASNIYLDSVRQEIVVHLDLPDIRLFTDLYKSNSALEKERKINEWKNKIKNLEYIVSNDIDEDLYTVNDIFSSFGFPTYVKVKIQTSLNSGFKKHDCKGLEEILNDLDILFSPNTSKIIRRTLDSVELFSELKHGNTEIFDRQFQALVGYLSEIKKNRPCHTGIYKIINSLTKIKDSQGTTKEKKSKMSCFVKKIKAYRSQANLDICNHANGVLTNNTKAIFLIGFSSTVVQFLAKFAEKNSQIKNNINVYILECGSKRRLSHKSQIEYNDGIQYSIEVGKLDFFNISIIPDVGFATILNLELGGKPVSKTLNSDYIMLIGTNGISAADNACGHTSGHLSTIVVARQFNIPVVLLSDTFKVGHIEWELNEKRKTNWLTTQKNHNDELKQYKIDILNYREDKIDISYLTSIVSNAGIITATDGQTSLSNGQLSELISVSDQFDSDLEKIVGK